MRVHEFLQLVAQTARAELKPSLRTFRTWRRYTLVQLYYTRRKIHYEVWVRGPERKLEIGLHCEADRATNSALLAVCDARLFEIQDALGVPVEAEQWTSTWTRVHLLMPYVKLDEPTAVASGKQLAALINVLEPIVRPAAENVPPPVRRTRARAPTPATVETPAEVDDAGNGAGTKRRARRRT